MALAVAVKPVGAVSALGAITAASPIALTYQSVGASGTATSNGIPINFGSAGFTAYVFVKAGGGGSGDISLSYLPMIWKDQTGELYGPAESLAPAGTFASDGVWYAVDFTPHATEKIKLQLANADVATATDTVVVLKYGGA